MAEALVVAALWSMAAAILVGFLAYRAGRANADRVPILTPDDDRVAEWTDDTNLAYVAQVQFDHTGNYDTLVIPDDGRTPHQAKRAIEDQIRDVSVTQIDRRKVYAFGPGSDPDER